MARVGACVLVLAGVASCASGDRERDRVGTSQLPIVNGELTTGDPAVVALVDRRPSCDPSAVSNPFCSGVLVAPRVVLTAAHCLRSTRAENIEIFFGSSVIRSGEGELRRAVSLTQHPDYVAGAVGNEAHDLALIELAHPASVKPLQLLQDGLDDTFIGRSVRLIGFGVEASAGSPGTKRGGSSTVSILDSLTFRYSGPAIVCHGDSGGAAILEVAGIEYLAGIAQSATAGCTDFGVETRIDTYLKFIRPFIDEVAARSPAPLNRDLKTNFCAQRCAAPEDCPEDMSCLPEGKYGNHCGFRQLRPGIFGATCAANAECNGGAGCVAVGAGEDRDCRCFALCDYPVTPPASAEPAAPEAGGCASSRGTSPRAACAWFVLAVGLAGARARRAKR